MPFGQCWQNGNWQCGNWWSGIDKVGINPSVFGLYVLPHSSVYDDQGKKQISAIFYAYKQGWYELIATMTMVKVEQIQFFTCRK